MLPAVALGGWVVNQAGAPVQFDYGFALVRNPYPLTLTLALTLALTLTLQRLP